MSVWRGGAPKLGDRAELTRTVGPPITTLRTSVTRGDGTVVLDGTAVCYTMSLD